MEEHLPELHQEFLTVEDRIDRCILDNKSTAELKSALKKYWIIHMKAIEEFERVGTTDSRDYKERRVDA